MDREGDGQAQKIGLHKRSLYCQLEGYIEPAGPTGKWRILEEAIWFPVPNRLDRASSRLLTSSDIASKPSMTTPTPFTKSAMWLLSVIF